ncbi:MAG: transcriptional regulator/antitoxin, MazE [Verrucomicrobia bacterium]|nr:MAG: transcriptional regulator/antitoxin, MazE [Verrucomicrobiota bacterium]
MFTNDSRSQGQISLPQPVREQLHLVPGGDLEVSVEDEDTITLRRVTHPANAGLVDLLLSCPAEFDIPKRDTDDSEPPSL